MYAKLELASAVALKTQKFNWKT